MFFLINYSVLLIVCFTSYLQMMRCLLTIPEDNMQ